MSVVTWLASDEPMELLEATLGGSQFFVDLPYYEHSPDLPDYASGIKPHRYSAYWANDEASLESMKKYLRANVKAGGSVELWQFWIGGGIVKPRKSARMPGKHIETRELAEIEADVDEFFQNRESYEAAAVSIEELSLEHLRYVSGNYGVCLIITIV